MTVLILSVLEKLENALGEGKTSALVSTSVFFLQGTFNATTSVFTIGSAASDSDYVIRPNAGGAAGEIFEDSDSLIILDNPAAAPVAGQFV